jgi:acyl-CoA synthetase (AMP-forming)/AMP-acid ligase II
MIQTSRRAPIEIPNVPLTRFLLESAAGHADRPAFVEAASGRSLTHGQWADAVRRGAAALAKRGLRKGDTFAIYSPNVPEYAIALHAAALIGGVVTTANPLYTADELAYQLGDSKAMFLATVPAFLEKASQAAAKAGVKEVFVFGEGPGATPFAELLANDAAPPEVAIDPRQDVVLLPYSSGTTGLPKGVMLTHANVGGNIAQTLDGFPELTADDVLAGVLPFFHSYGLVVIMNAVLRLGARAITMPRFEMEAFLEMIQKHRVTCAHLVPPIILGLAKHPAVDRYDLSSLKQIVSGAAPLGGNVAQACAARLGCSVLQGYGLTETSPVSHVGVVEKPGSIGRPLPNTECKVASLIDGSELGPGEQGEIWIRGPQVMKGYLNRPDATAAMIDADGWLHTGDIGCLDDDGDLYVVDRVKELIKYKGLQIAPAELEAVLLGHPAIADAAVIPIPDEEAGEVPKAFVLLKGDATVEEILAFVAARVAPHKKIRRVEIVDQIPKTPSGKILRRLLVAQERARAAQA